MRIGWGVIQQYQNMLILLDGAKTHLIFSWHRIARPMSDTTYYLIFTWFRGGLFLLDREKKSDGKLAYVSGIATLV